MQEEATKKSIRDFVKEEVSTQVSFCKKKFKLPDDWSPSLKITFDKKKINSMGGRNMLGKPFMILSVASFLQPVNGFLEYDRYTTNMLIGSFKSKSWQLCVRALISHELAHAVEFTMPAVMAKVEPDCPEQAMFYNMSKEGWDHGNLFRLIYKALRIEFVNEHVEQYCMGVKPQPVPKPKHAIVGTTFQHDDLGKCCITNYFPSSRYPYEFMDVKGDLYKACQRRMELFATFGSLTK